MTQSGVVYSRSIEGRTFTFGVSGRLYKSNVLLYDHQTESLWSQLLSEAVTGEMAGRRLKMLPALRTSWKAWHKRHPGTAVLSTETGYSRDYDRDPYVGYYQVGTIWFPVGDVRKDLSPKTRVVGIERGGKSKAYSLDTITKEPGTLEDRIGDALVRIHVADDGEIAGVRDEAGNPVPHMFVFWFAWQAFHPDTEVLK